MDKWDWRYLRLATEVAEWSKDPSTHVGAILVKDRDVWFGYNGFPTGVKDDHRLNDRETKYEIIIHGEMNALLKAGNAAQGSTLYLWPFLSCSRCTVHAIQAGVKRVVFPEPTEEQLSRWGKSFQMAKDVYQEVGVELVEVSRKALEVNMKEYL